MLTGQIAEMVKGATGLNDEQLAKLCLLPVWLLIYRGFSSTVLLCKSNFLTMS